MLEEIFRLARSGDTAAFQMLGDVGTLDVLVPVLEEYLGPDDGIPSALSRSGTFSRRSMPTCAPAPKLLAPGLIVALLYALPCERHLVQLSSDDEVPDAQARLKPRGSCWMAWRAHPSPEEGLRAGQEDPGCSAELRGPPERFSEVLFADPRSSRMPFCSSNCAPKPGVWGSTSSRPGGIARLAPAPPGATAR